jgi:CubicO group peptidase (beta-lactamase class C family)
MKLIPFAGTLSLLFSAACSAATSNADTLVSSAVFTHEGSCKVGNAAPEGLPRFHAASISKLFTATVIMQLRDEARLSLRDPVSKYVPEFAGSRIDIEQLLIHTSGLRDRHRAEGRTSRAQWDAYILELAKQPLANEPGAQWAYSDAGFNLLGRVIENVSGGKPYADVLKQRLLDPLEMTASTFEISQVPEAQRVRASDKNGLALEHPWDVVFLASSGLQTDARDLAKFGREMLVIAAGHKGHGVLRAETLREMTSVRVSTQWAGVSQGYGWQLEGVGADSRWRHAGGERGFESLLILYPAEDFGVVVMGNRKDWGRFERASALATEARATCLPSAARKAAYMLPALTSP